MLLTDGEGINQGYSCLQFSITSIRQGSLPIWDPYTLAGHSFVGGDESVYRLTRYGFERKAELLARARESA